MPLSAFGSSATDENNNISGTSSKRSTQLLPPATKVPLAAGSCEGPTTRWQTGRSKSRSAEDVLQELDKRSVPKLAVTFSGTPPAKRSRSPPSATTASGLADDDDAPQFKRNRGGSETVVTGGQPRRVLGQSVEELVARLMQGDLDAATSHSFELAVAGSNQRAAAPTNGFSCSFREAAFCQDMRAFATAHPSSDFHAWAARSTLALDDEANRVTSLPAAASVNSTAGSTPSAPRDLVLLWDTVVAPMALAETFARNRAELQRAKEELLLAISQRHHAATTHSPSTASVAGACLGLQQQQQQQQRQQQQHSRTAVADAPRVGMSYPRLPTSSPPMSPRRMPLATHARRQHQQQQRKQQRARARLPHFRHRRRNTMCLRMALLRISTGVEVLKVRTTGGGDYTAPAAGPKPPPGQAKAKAVAARVLFGSKVLRQRRGGGGGGGGGGAPPAAAGGCLDVNHCYSSFSGRRQPTTLSWSKRWMSLCETTAGAQYLVCKKQAESKEILSALDLNEVTNVALAAETIDCRAPSSSALTSTDQTRTATSFVVETAARRYVFQTHTEAVAAQWVDKLNSLGEQRRKEASGTCSPLQPQPLLRQPSYLEDPLPFVTPVSAQNNDNNNSSSSSSSSSNHHHHTEVLVPQNIFPE